MRREIARSPAEEPPRRPARSGKFRASLTVDAAAPRRGQVLVRNMWMSVDPYMRGRMCDRPSYVPPFQIGEALQGGAVGRRSSPRTTRSFEARRSGGIA